MLAATLQRAAAVAIALVGLLLGAQAYAASSTSRSCKLVFRSYTSGVVDAQCVNRWPCDAGTCVHTLRFSDGTTLVMPATIPNGMIGQTGTATCWCMDMGISTEAPGCGPGQLYSADPADVEFEILPGGDGQPPRVVYHVPRYGEGGPFPDEFSCTGPCGNGTACWYWKRTHEPPTAEGLELEESCCCCGTWPLCPGCP